MMSAMTHEQMDEMEKIFAASMSRNEVLTRKQRFEAGKFSMELARANDDPPENDPVFQKELSTFGASLRAAGVPYSQTAIAFDAVDGGGYPQPEFILAITLLATPAITALAKAAAAWVQARNGRKMRLKIGDIEAEGRSIKEIEELLKKATEFQKHDEK
jgi:hypothetical protein